jgi:hypothetical protein
MGPHRLVDDQIGVEGIVQRGERARLRIASQQPET